MRPLNTFWQQFLILLVRTIIKKIRRCDHCNYPFKDHEKKPCSDQTSQKNHS